MTVVKTAPHMENTSLIVKQRAEMTGRNISKNATLIIPAHNIPAFKPANCFKEEVAK